MPISKNLPTSFYKRDFSAYLPGPFELVIPVPEGALEVGEEGVVLRIGGRHHHQLRPHVAEHRL